MIQKVILLIGLLHFGSTATAAVSAAEKSATTVYPSVLTTYPHDPGAFTQGLVYCNSKLYESTGLVGKSSLRVLDTSGKILKNTPISDLFAEGCTIFKNKLYQITWQEMQCIVYSFPELKIAKVVAYSGEGWGLTNDSKSMIMSNGSDTLFFRDSAFSVVKKVAVRLDGKPLRNLNELEFARNKVYANVWYNNGIYEIDPLTGAVTRVIDCSAIVKDEQVESDQNVLNGIAYVASTDKFYITGKNWKHMYLVSISK
jgi:glutaminyl-peptide cyclotransferase